MDQNTFINTYIDLTVNSLLEHVKTNLQLQTQVRVNEIVVTEKDQVIASLNQRLNENVVAEDWKVKYESAEANYAAAMQKLSHMDTLLNQVSEMKKMIHERDEKLAIISQENSDLKVTIDQFNKQQSPLSTATPTKVINTKTKKKEPEIKLDDF